MPRPPPFLVKIVVLQLCLYNIEGRAQYAAEGYYRQPVHQQRGLGYQQSGVNRSVEQQSPQRSFSSYNQPRLYPQYSQRTGNSVASPALEAVQPRENDRRQPEPHLWRQKKPFEPRVVHTWGHRYKRDIDLAPAAKPDDNAVSHSYAAVEDPHTHFLSMDSSSSSAEDSHNQLSGSTSMSSAEEEDQYIVDNKPTTSAKEANHIKATVISSKKDLDFQPASSDNNSDEATFDSNFHPIEANGLETKRLIPDTADLDNDKISDKSHELTVSVLAPATRKRLYLNSQPRSSIHESNARTKASETKEIITDGSKKESKLSLTRRREVGNEIGGERVNRLERRQLAELIQSYALLEAVRRALPTHHLSGESRQTDQVQNLPKSNLVEDIPKTRTLEPSRDLSVQQQDAKGKSQQVEPIPKFSLLGSQQVEQEFPRHRSIEFGLNTIRKSLGNGKKFTPLEADELQQRLCPLCRDNHDGPKLKHSDYSADWEHLSSANARSLKHSHPISMQDL